MNLTQGQVTVFDKILLEPILEKRWYAQRMSSGIFYAVTAVNKRKIMMHTEIMMLYGDFLIGREVDHIDHNTLDNRKCNLRVVTHSQNMKNCNIRINNKSGYVGVILTKSGKYRAQITSNGIAYYLGTFSCPIQAAKKYNEMAIQFGFEMLNNV